VVPFKTDRLLYPKVRYLVSGGSAKVHLCKDAQFKTHVTVEAFVSSMERVSDGTRKLSGSSEYIRSFVVMQFESSCPPKIPEACYSTLLTDNIFYFR
jgi:hypothetical protein